jgi:hypothetical protein
MCVDADRRKRICSLERSYLLWNPDYQLRVLGKKESQGCKEYLKSENAHGKKG